MAVLLVTYDLKAPGQDYADFHKVIKSFSWARLSESSYAIDTTLTPQNVYEQLRSHMDTNDNVYVIMLTRPHCGYGPKEVNEWLEKHLP